MDGPGPIWLDENVLNYPFEMGSKVFKNAYFTKDIFLSSAKPYDFNIVEHGDQASKSIL